MTIVKFTGDMISRGKNFVKTIELKSQVYGEAPEYKIAVDIKPISRKDLTTLFKKYGVKEDQSNLDMEKADGLMSEVCKLGLVDQTIVSALDDIAEFLSIKIGSEILALSTGSGVDLENFSNPKKD
jgi:hypothetical protein